MLAQKLAAETQEVEGFNSTLKSLMARAMNISLQLAAARIAIRKSLGLIGVRGVAAMKWSIASRLLKRCSMKLVTALQPCRKCSMWRTDGLLQGRPIFQTPSLRTKSYALCCLTLAKVFPGLPSKRRNSGGNRMCKALQKAIPSWPPLHSNLALKTQRYGCAARLSEALATWSDAKNSRVQRCKL